MRGLHAFGKFSTFDTSYAPYCPRIVTCLAYRSLRHLRTHGAPASREPRPLLFHPAALSPLARDDHEVFGVEFDRGGQDCASLGEVQSNGCQTKCIVACQSEFSLARLPPPAQRCLSRQGTQLQRRQPGKPVTVESHVYSVVQILCLMSESAEMFLNDCRCI
jgi:hypothetical protein